MYDAIHSTDAAARYSDAKEAIRDRDRSRAPPRPEAGLARMKAVFRSQFC
jgi:hypothetical protein